MSFKSPGGRGFDWHQDIVFFPSSNLSPLMTLAFLEDVTLEMGPTRVIPGSHRGPVYDHYDTDGKWLGLIGEHEKNQIKHDDAVSVTGPAGSILITNCAILHSALPNGSGHRRPMVIIGYQSADAISYADIPYQSRYKWGNREWSSVSFCAYRSVRAEDATRLGRARRHPHRQSLPAVVVRGDTP